MRALDIHDARGDQVVVCFDISHLEQLQNNLSAVCIKDIEPNYCYAKKKY